MVLRVKLYRCCALTQSAHVFVIQFIFSTRPDWPRRAWSVCVLNSSLCLNNSSCCLHNECAITWPLLRNRRTCSALTVRLHSFSVIASSIGKIIGLISANFKPVLVFFALVPQDVKCSAFQPQISGEITIQGSNLLLLLLKPTSNQPSYIYHAVLSKMWRFENRALRSWKCLNPQGSGGGDLCNCPYSELMIQECHHAVFRTDSLCLLRQQDRVVFVCVSQWLTSSFLFIFILN